MESEKIFTIVNGLEYQAKDLSEWKSILKPEVFKLLKMEIDKLNKKRNYKNGYDVVRGCQIDNAMLNFMSNGKFLF